MTKIFQILTFLSIPYLLLSQSTTLQWLDDDIIIVSGDTIDVLAFEGGEYVDGSFLPYYTYSKKLTVEEAENFEYDVTISELTSSAISDVSNVNMAYIKEDFKLISNVTSSRKEYALEIIIIPFKNSGNKISRLESFQLNVSAKPIIKLKSATGWFANSSVLASGNWNKVAVKETGIYKLSYGQLFDMGLNPENVSVFTSTPGQLSKLITDYVDDLKEIPIYVDKGSDGVFNNNDFILFYAQGPNVWDYNYSKGKYIHTQHSFWDENYYYITSDVGDKKRISTATTITGTSTMSYSTFLDYDIIEPQDYTISHSGDDWYSEPILNGQSFSHTFSFENIVKESSIMEMGLCARSISATHKMKTYIDANFKESISLKTALTKSISIIAYETNKSYYFVPQSDNITASMVFECTENTAKALVDYFSVKVKRSLEFNNKSLIFRNKPSSDSIVTYQLDNAASVNFIWEVSNVYDVQSIIGQTNNGKLSFKAIGNKVNEFIAINSSSSFPSPTIIGKVENQNIHAMDVPDMVILTHKDFEAVAEDLANVHRKDGLEVFIVTQDKIFNEFSGGKADVTAIRWMMKMFYDRSTVDNDFQYLLLLGDGSINNTRYEKHIASETIAPSLILTFQSDASLDPSHTYVSDDYYGLLDDAEGESLELNDKVDIGIGRIPINSAKEGYDVVNKIDKYTHNSKRSIWKNRVCLVADDEDENLHASDADDMAEIIRRDNKGMAVKKIYIDAFKQEENAEEHTYPDAKKMSDHYIEEGTLIWGYSGHGSPIGLSGEKIMHISDINSYENLANLPLWLTATCDFCPYDHNDEISAGERVLFNPIGGGIALFTTTRLVYSSSNKTISSSFYNYIFNSDNNGEKLRLGDVSRLTKKDIGTGANKRKFCLIGDPALQIVNADARWSVETDSINGQDIALYTDTLQALSTMSVSGHIAKSDGSVDTNYNGVLFPIVYDKINNLTTLNNDNDVKDPLDFLMWSSTLYNGKTYVTNGRFTFSFLLPKDIDYTPGKGRIEYYATSDEVEVNGFYEDFYIGGFNKDYIEDNDGPELNLYMNSPFFQEGGTVNPNPMLIADVTDVSGINSSGNSIGHDITVMLDNDPNSIDVINSNYTTSAVNYKQGTIAYQLKDLEVGNHTLVLKVWDMQNNSSSKEIKFEVKNDALPEIAAIYCYPNPVSLSSGEMVRFVAEHDRPDKTLSVNLNIFDGVGKLVYYSSQYSYSASNEVYFDWTPSSATLTAGLYFYRITIDDGVEVSTGKSEKLILAQ